MERIEYSYGLYVLHIASTPRIRLSNSEVVSFSALVIRRKYPKQIDCGTAAVLTAYVHFRELGRL